MTFWEKVMLYVGSFGMALPIVVLLFVLYSVVIDSNFMFGLMRNGLYYYLIIGIALILAIPITFIRKLF